MTGTNDSAMPTSPAAHKPAASPCSWGGRRPGAGAPKGNLNHLKHGFDSKTITLAAVIVSTFPEVHRLFEAIVNTTDRARYRRLLATARTNNNSSRRRRLIPLQDSIKTDLAFALLQRLDRIQQLEIFFAKYAGESRQSRASAERFYESVRRTHPDLYHQWFGAYADDQKGRHRR